ncbi:protein PERCC1 [Aplysia californica]|uniref:Protein PERCC1 n=1 Tax=Aplysia californica TaxID=6500 RepID=A0ABM1A849_APLCA|nr:protein PERCC1 [Aplysia californica]
MVSTSNTRRQHHQPQPQQQQQQQQQQQPLSEKTSYEAPYSYQSSAPTVPPIPASSVYGEEEFEDVDDDDISDFDEEELRLSYEQYRQSIRHPDVTSQLLNFADVVSADIKKFFGRAKDQEDSCDVYEDKWATTKSGRELYYADLLRIAQGDSEPASKSNKESCKDMISSSSSPSSSSLSPREDLDNRTKFSGKRNDTIGMGPLSELFDFGLKHFLQDRKHRNPNVSGKAKISTLGLNSYSEATRSSLVPMTERKFPESFWREPGTNVLHSLTEPNRTDISQLTALTASKLPDFSDLVESWQGGVEGMESVSVGHEKTTRLEMSMDHHRL